MEDRYNIYYAGQLLEGHDLSSVRDKIARLFNADPATVDKLFSGKPQLVKRDCDKATALKYRQAIEQAGALPMIKRIATDSAPAPVASKPLSAAQRIAALAAAPDLGAPSKPAAATARPKTEEVAAGGIALAPEGTAVLRPEERSPAAASTVKALNLEVSASGQRLSELQAAPPPPPDTSHLSEGTVGELLPRLPSSLAPLNPDTSAIELSPDGTDFSDCAAPAAAPPALDLTGMNLAPAGADVLESQYRKKPAQPPPPTDHLALED